MNSRATGPGTAPPKVMPVNMTMIMVARARRGANSALSAITLGSMPPMPMPVRKRKAMSELRPVAHMVARLKMPITRHEATSALMRPILSPIQPKIGEPKSMPKRPALNAVPSAAMLVMPQALTSDGPA